MDLVKGLKAIASARRLRMLEVIRDPSTPRLETTIRGAVYRGVTASTIQRHVGLTQPSVSEQLQILLDVGLVESRKVGRVVLYALDADRVKQFRQTIMDELVPPT